MTQNIRIHLATYSFCCKIIIITQRLLGSNMVCDSCKKASCIWDEHEDSILEKVSDWKIYGRFQSNSTLRKKCYQYFAAVLYGHLGHGNRRELPECIVENVRQILPNENASEYMGFKQS